MHGAGTPAISIHHDTVDPTHPLLVDCFAGQILQGAGGAGRHAAAVPGCCSSPTARATPPPAADSYRLMRLLWEQAGLGRAEVGFVRHTQPFLPETLQRCLSEPSDGSCCRNASGTAICVTYAGVMLADHQRAHPEAASWRLLDPPRDHPAILAWLEQRVLRLWQEKRAREAARIPSAEVRDPPAEAEVWSGEGWAPAGEAPISRGWVASRRAREFRRAGRNPLAGPPPCGALPGESDLARLRSRDLHGTGSRWISCSVRCPAPRSCWRDTQAAGTWAAWTSTGRPTPSGTATGSVSRISNS